MAFENKLFAEKFSFGSFPTDWGEWAEPVPYIHDKFGDRPQLRPIKWGKHRWTWDEKVLDETVKTNPVIYLAEGSNIENINQLFRAYARLNEPRLIITESKIRCTAEVPANVNFIYVNGHAWQFSKMFDQSGIRPRYDRNVRNLSHTFLMMAANPLRKYEGPKILMMLEALGALKDALYSCPDLLSVESQYIKDDIGINLHMKNMKQRHIGEYLTYNHRKNLPIISKHLNHCHFHVARSPQAIYDHYWHWGVDEKHLQGYASMTPVLPIWADPEAEQMGEWGFRFNNIRGRSRDESEQETIIRWCREILFHVQIARNQEWSQSWQDLQSQNASHNFALLKKLHHVIKKDIEKQIDELPNEFKNV